MLRYVYHWSAFKHLVGGDILYDSGLYITDEPVDNDSRYSMLRRHVESQNLEGMESCSTHIRSLTLLHTKIVPSDVALAVE